MVGLQLNCIRFLDPPTGCQPSALQEQEPSPAPVAVAVKPKASPAARESAVSGGLRVPTSLRSAATMALEREEEAAAARRKRIDELAIVRKVGLPTKIMDQSWTRYCSQFV